MVRAATAGKAGKDWDSRGLGFNNELPVINTGTRRIDFPRLCNQSFSFHFFIIKVSDIIAEPRNDFSLQSF